MFENLTGRLSDAARNLSGKGRLTESNIKDTLRQVRLALLEADVALPVVKTFIERIREQAVGEAISKSLTPGQALVKIIHGELVRILGDEHAPINLIVLPRSCNSKPWQMKSVPCIVRAGRTTNRLRSLTARWTKRAGRMPTS
jgi:signal recognition particle GTPase